MWQCYCIHPTAPTFCQVICYSVPEDLWNLEKKQNIGSDWYWCLKCLFCVTVQSCEYIFFILRLFLGTLRMLVITSLFFLQQTHNSQNGTQYTYGQCVLPVPKEMFNLVRECIINLLSQLGPQPALLLFPTVLLRSFPKTPSRGQQAENNEKQCWNSDWLTWG